MLRRGLDALYALSALLAALALLGVFGIMMAQVVLRQLGMQLPGADDIVAYLCVSMTFLALAHTLRHGEMIRVGLVIERLPPRSRRWMELAVLALAVLMVGIILRWTLADTLFSREIEEVAQGTVAFPLWVPKLAIPLGAAILLVALLDDAASVLRGRTPAYARVAAGRAAQQDFRN